MTRNVAFPPHILNRSLAPSRHCAGEKEITPGMVTSLTWIPSPILCFEVNASAEDITYSITRHTLAGRTQGAHLASAGELALGRFAEGPAGMKAAKLACQAHAASRG
jgi:hypothetical protein